MFATSATDTLRERIDEPGPRVHNRWRLITSSATIRNSSGRALPMRCRGICRAGGYSTSCKGGFYLLEMKRRGAETVVAIDSDPRYLRQAGLVAEVTGLAIERHQMSVYRVECRKGSTSGCMAGSTARAAMPTAVAHSDPG